MVHVGLNTALLSPGARLVLGTGVMGGFTTYSTFKVRVLKYASGPARAPKA
jgi:fluoride ion exporter CrcB/FEX